MSTSVDNRVVSMEFDNSKFEKNVSTTMNTLDKLNDKLKLNDAAKGLENVDAASKKVDMSALSNGVEYVRVKFSALQIMATTALTNITNSAVNAGKRIISSLTIDPIKTGLSEYETQLNSVQTILANTESKGSTLKDVNSALDELNAYADKTIYNFTEMTRNIGTFTAAGVDLDKSVAAIKGIANLAAVSGSTSQQASTAMYQLSQALSSGTLKLMDWNSVVNAGMGGQVFQDALKETARVHGVEIDKMIKEQGSFRETLQKGWLTSEVLLETLQKFTGDLNEEQLKSMGYTEKQIADIMKLGKTANDAATKVKTFTQLLDTLAEAAQSGWSQTWKIIMGDFEESKELWTKVSDVIGDVINKSSEARNTLLDGAFTSGWKQLLGAGIMDEEGYSHFIKKVAKEHGIAIDEMIKEEGSLEKALKKGLKTGEITSDMFSDALNRLSGEYKNFSIDQITNLGYTKEQADALIKLNEEVQNGTISMEEYAEKIKRLSGRELVMESFANIYKAIVNVITPIKEAFREIFPPATSEQLYKLLEGFKNLTAKLILNEEQMLKLKQAFKGLFAVVDIVVTVIKTAVSTAWKLLGSLSGIGTGVLSVSASFGELLSKLRDYVKESNIFTTISSGIIKVVEKVIDVIKRLYKTLAENIKFPSFDGLLKVMAIVWNTIKTICSKIVELVGKVFSGDGNFLENISSLFDIFSSGMFIAVLAKIKDIFSSVEDITGGFGDILEGVSGSLEAFQTKLKAGALKEIAVAIAILAASILVISFIDPEKLEDSMAAITLSLGLLIGALSILTKNQFQGRVAIKNLIGIAASLLILSFALARLGTLSPKEVITGLVTMAGALVILTGVLALMSKIQNINKNATKQLITMSISLIILGFALKKLGSMSWEEIGKSLTVMASSLATFMAFLAVMSAVNKPKGIGNLITISVSLIILGTALKKFASMSWDEIGKAMTVMTTSIATLMVFLAVLSVINKPKGIAMLLSTVISLTILGEALEKFASMSWDEIGRAMTVMTTSLASFIVFLAVLSVMNKPKGVAMLLSTVISLTILGEALEKFASMSWDEIGKAMVVMEASIATLMVFLAVMSAISSGKTLAGAAALLVTVAAIGALVPVLALLGNLKTETIVKGLLTIAAALTIFGVAGILLKSAVPAMLAFAGSATLIGVSLVLVGTGIAIIAAGLSLLITSIAALITAIVAGGAAIVATLVSFVRSVIELVPLLLIGVAEGIVGLCAVIAEGAPIIGEAIAAVIIAAIDACVKVIPALVEGLAQIIIGVLDSLVEFIPDLVGAILKLLIGIIEAIGEYLPSLIQAGVNLLMKFFEGVIQALNNIDTSILVKGILAVGFLAALIVALSAIAALIPGAMLAVLGMGAVVAELALVLAAIGALARIPGLIDIINDGGALLLAVGGAIGKFIGGIISGFAEGLTSSLPAIGTNLSDFMTNLQPFIDGLRQLDPTVLEAGKTLASLLLTITAANLIEQLTSWLAGEASMAQFGAELGAFGKGIKQFADEVKGIDSKTVAAAAEAGKNLGEMAKAIPSEGGLWDLISGKNDIESFGQQLKGFGSGVKQFANEIKGIDPEQVKMAAEAGKTLGKMAKDIPTSGGLWDMIAGENNIEGFGGQLKGFGSGVRKFYEETKDVNIESVKAAAEAGKTLGKMASDLPTTGGLWNAIKGDINMANFGLQLKTFGSAMKDFVNEVSDIGDVSHISDQVKSLNESLRAFSLSSVDNLTAPFVEGQNKLADTISSMIQVAVETVKSKAVQFAEAGVSMLDQFIKSVKSCQTKVKNAFLSIINDGVIPYMKNESMYRKFYSIGKYFVQGFASGISENSYLAAAKAEAMANAAATAAAEALDEHSPSKVGYHIGDYFGYAFVDAISKYEAKAYSAGTNMGIAVKSGLQKAITIASNLIENGIDSQPTIRPVLDLSEVAAGAGTINGMFGMTPSVGVLSNVNAISSAMNGNQNSANADVISAIADLKNTLENTSGDTYNLNGITYDNGSEIANAINTIVRAAKIERRR